MKGYSRAAMASKIVNALCIQFEEGFILCWFLKVLSFQIFLQEAPITLFSNPTSD